MSDLHESLFTTEYGEILSQNVRFGRFKPEWLPNQVWVELLGDDVDNYKHMEYTASLTSWYIGEAARLEEPFSEDDADLLMLTAWTHDFAEAIDGDVPDPEKVDSLDVREQERRSFIEVASKVTEDPVKLANTVLPVIQGEHPLSRHFRAIEIIGYMETGKRAIRALKGMGELQHTYGYDFEQLHEIYHNLQSLGNEVIEVDTRRLKRDYPDFPVVRSYLGLPQNRWDDMGTY